MGKEIKTSRFEANLQRPAKTDENGSWAFLILPKSASEILPRRGRTSVDVTINGHSFQTTLDPDGQLSHWLKLDEKLMKASGVKVGDPVTVEISPAKKELEPALPSDLEKALAKSPKAKEVWDDTTTLARVDWVHWIESAKQAKTRKSRIESACDMLSSGKRRVCCFDQSGFYSKSLSAPRAAE